MSTEVAIRALADLSSGSMPLPAQEGDGNAWEPGACWLYCERLGVPVLWIGPVTAVGGISAPLFACMDCLTRLWHKAVEHMRSRDAPSVKSLQGGGRHARRRAPWVPWLRLP
ncbi:hypothetical protein ACWC5I_02960 [Kitasatospora sp. NPDC001574]